MGKQSCEGVIGAHVSIKVSASEMASWPADRITEFFNGIAMSIYAAKGGEVVIAADPPESEPAKGATP